MGARNIIKVKAAQSSTKIRMASRLPILLLLCLIPLLASALGEEEKSHEVEASSAELQASVVKREAKKDCGGKSCRKKKKAGKKGKKGKISRRKTQKGTKKGKKNQGKKSKSERRKQRQRKTKAKKKQNNKKNQNKNENKGSKVEKKKKERKLS